ncbi:MAG: helix-turn-helix domain-containing protein [Candidatus Eremiobacteraeota bacterium]|nr:helix-turn-helix domain-containing protein [Candidatus Eremiobacteraeota bacterium]
MEAVYAANTLTWTQLEPGDFAMRARILNAPPLELSWRQFNLGFQVEAALNPQATMIGVVADPRTRARWFGSPVDSATIAATSSSVDVRAEGAGAFFQVGIDTAALVRAFPDTPDAFALTENIHGVALARDRHNAAKLRAQIHLLFSSAITMRSSLRRGSLVKALPGTLVPLLASVLESHPHRSVEAPRSHTRRLSAVRACETYMRAHVDSTITLLDLSAISGMRSRSLINAFQAVTGLTPIDYLKRIRLNGVRRALRRSRKAHTRIIDVATAWGFWHMGHFAADYRAMFGESPSSTLLS